MINPYQSNRFKTQVASVLKVVLLIEQDICKIMKRSNLNQHKKLRKPFFFL